MPLQRLKPSNIIAIRNWLSPPDRLALSSRSTVKCFHGLGAPFQMSSLSGMDRKAMEEDRLARRANKRSATLNEDCEDSPRKIAKANVDEGAEQNNSETTAAPPLLHENQQALKDLRFPHGVIKKTWAFGHERQDDIKIEEVLQKHDLKTAILSSFQWDFEWLATKIDPKNTKFIFVMQAKTEKEKQVLRDDFQGLRKIRLCFPPLSGAFACQHSKLMLLFFKDFLRIVVPSANLTKWDWGETGIMENSVFLIDLPRLPVERQSHANDTLTPFSTELLRFLEAMDIHEDVRYGILNFDFTNTNQIRFVHTIAGSHLGLATKLTGFPGLSRAIRDLRLDGLYSSSGMDLEIDMTISSVGAIEHDTIQSLYRALHGLEPETPSKTKSKDGIGNEALAVNAQNFRVIFPTRDTVHESTGGPENGGTIFLKPEYFQRPKFPSKLFRDYKSRRTGLLSHNKLIFARSATKAFVYTGSANLSNAAWGRLSYDAATKGPKLTAANWECGVVMPAYQKITTSADARNESDVASPDETALPELKVLPVEVFDSVFAVPFEYPAKPYEKNQLPWCAGT